jgi:esterase/lipase superfamily enzyme
LTVPENRTVGSIPRPGFLSAENPERHYILHEVNQEDEASFVARLSETIAADTRRQLLVFIHGFNVTFVDAVYRTAQIAADLDFSGAAALFSWPSVADLSKNGYIADIDQADYAVEHLPAFLNLATTKTGAQMVHIIAHSMGNRLLVNAIQKVKVDAPTIKFTELMLTAPDIDTDIFVTQIAPSVIGAARRTTLYVSSKDEALHWSNRFRPRPRVGDSSSEVVIVDGIETVDVSDVSTGFVGHSYYGENKSVLSDIFGVMRGVVPAERFGLRQSKFRERTYWLFRP